MGQPTLKDLQILVIDNDLDSRELLKLVLEIEGAEVLAVDSVQAALQVINTSAPDVLLSDLNLSDEDDCDLIRYVKDLETERGVQLPAIALTAHADEKNSEQVLSSGFQSYLSKPVDLEWLTIVVMTLTGRT